MPFHFFHPLNFFGIMVNYIKGFFHGWSWFSSAPSLVMRAHGLDSERIAFGNGSAEQHCS